MLLLLHAGLDNQLAARGGSTRAHHNLLWLLLLTGIQYPLLYDLSLGVENIVHNLSLWPDTGVLLYHLTGGLLLLLDDLPLLGWMDDFLDDLSARLLNNLSLGHNNLLTRLDSNWALVLLNRRLWLLQRLLLWLLNRDWLLLCRLLNYLLLLLHRYGLLLGNAVDQLLLSPLQTTRLMGGRGLGRGQLERQRLGPHLDPSIMVLSTITDLLFIGARAAPEQRPYAECIVLGGNDLLAAHSMHAGQVLLVHDVLLDALAGRQLVSGL